MKINQRLIAWGVLVGMLLVVISLPLIINFYTLKNANQFQSISLRQVSEQEKIKLYLYEALNYNYADFKLLDRIANAESGLKQFNQNGDVLRGMINKNDIGIFQINSKYHEIKAKELGYDIYEWRGNINYAVWLYKQEGTKPWNWSKSIWNK